MKRLDFNCYTGNWPFFRVRCNSIAKLTELHSRCNIEGGFVSACEAIFYQDPFEAELLLSKELAGTPYMQAMVLNPTIPGWKEEIDRCVTQLNIKAIRLTPGFHGYALTDPVMDEVNDMLRKYRLPLLLTLRIRDERSSWMVHPRKISLDEISAYLDKSTDIITILSCLRMNEMGKLKDYFIGRSNLFTDISGFKDGNFAIERACNIIGSEHILYGSSAPLLNLHSTTILVDQADLPQEAKATIFSGVSLFGLI